MRNLQQHKHPKIDSLFPLPVHVDARLFNIEDECGATRKRWQLARRQSCAGGLGLILVESRSNLASVAFSAHHATGAIAAKHFMAVQEALGRQHQHLVPAGA